MNGSCPTSGLFPVNANKLTVRWVEVAHSYMGQRLILKEVELPDVWQLVSIIPTTPFNAACNTSDHSRLKFPVAFHNLFLLYFIPKSVCKSLSFFSKPGTPGGLSTRWVAGESQEIFQTHGVQHDGAASPMASGHKQVCVLLICYFFLQYL